MMTIALYSAHVVVVAFALLVRILGERLTIHSYSHAPFFYFLL